MTTKAAKGKDLETLRRENEHLKRLLAEKALEVDFFEVPCSKLRLDPRSSRALAGPRGRRAQGSRRLHLKVGEISARLIMA